MTSPLFTEQEWLRYTRHVQLKGFGADGQTCLKKSKILIVGMGGLGSPVSLYLAAAGVGHLTIIDGDTVDLTNLQRQVIYTHDDIGLSKAACAKKRLLALNSDISITAIEEHFTPDTTFNEDFDLVLDCTDNFPVRYLINDFCHNHQLAWVYASIHQHSGQCAFFKPGEACFRCLFPQAPSEVEDCNSAGVIGVLPGLLGLFQANEALKYLAGQSPALDNKLMLFDANKLSMQKIALAKDPSCLCGEKHIDKNQQDYLFVCASESSEADNSKPNDTAVSLAISTTEFNRLREKDGVTVIDVRDKNEREAFHIGGMHIALSELEGRYSEIDKDQTIVCYCQTGIRSQNAAQLLAGFGLKAKSLEGGLVGWLKSVS